MRKQLIIALAIALAVPLTPNLPMAAASDTADKVKLGVMLGGVAYHSYREKYTSLIKDPQFQEEIRKKLIEKKGLNEEPYYNAVTNRTIKNLMKSVDVPVADLPFNWFVNNSADMNASCGLANVVTVNKGLIDGLNGNEHEIAYVLAHEITHGVKGHVLGKLIGQAVTQTATLPFVADRNYLSGVLVNLTANYIYTKNLPYAQEVEADAQGFAFMVKAGYNPGAGAATMVKLQEYAERMQVVEVDNFIDPSEHPNNKKREKNLAKLMTDYSQKHVEVIDNQVYIDKTLFMTAAVSPQQSAKERAYLVAGALAKAFHDYASADQWAVDVTGDGLASSRNGYVYFKPLPEEETGAVYAVRLQGLLSKAYRGIRYETVKDNKEKIKPSRRITEQAEMCNTRGNTYADLKKYDLAIIEYDKAIALSPKYSYPYFNKGNTYYKMGDYQQAVAVLTVAIGLDGKDKDSYNVRGNAYSKLHQYDAAISDFKMAIKIDPQYGSAYHNMGEVYHSLGDFDTALAHYKKGYALKPSLFELIPAQYRPHIK